MSVNVSRIVSIFLVLVVTSLVYFGYMVTNPDKASFASVLTMFFLAAALLISPQRNLVMLFTRGRTYEWAAYAAALAIVVLFALQKVEITERLVIGLIVASFFLIAVAANHRVHPPEKTRAPD